MATLRDISKLVNTSEATVSLVLNGHYHRVSEKTRQRIEAAAAKLGYRPNRVAQNLARGKTMNIMVLLNDLGNPFYAGLASMISELLEPHGYHLMPAETRGNPVREAELLDLASRQVCDGVLCLEALPDQRAEIYADIARRIPFVIRYQIYPELTGELPPGLSRLGINYGRGIEVLFDHLRDLGIRKMGLLLNTAHDPTRDLSMIPAVAVFWRYLLKRSSWLEKHMIRCVCDVDPLENWYEQCRQMLSDNPDLQCLYVHHLRAVPPVYAAIEECGKKPGRDIAVASVDDQELAKWLRPGVTVVAEDLTKTAQSAVTALLGMLAGNAKHVEITHDARVITRDSTLMYQASR